MSKEEILEGNKLIAEFMGVDDSIPHDHQGIYLYHCSWDWLMPVVEKISNIKHWSINSTIEYLNERYEFDGFYCGEDLFKAVILYIKDSDETN